MHRLNPRKKMYNQSGFSLIQVAIGISILGILIAPFGSAYYLHEKKRRMDSNFLKIERVVGAIRSYKSLTGHYPCPAPLDVARDSNKYGYPLACNTPAFAASVPSNSCGEGICVETSIRSDITNRRLVYGAVPFRVLQMDERDSIDSYNTRIAYVVTESMTDVTTFNERLAGIAVRDEDNTPMSDPDGGIGFIIISHGPNKVGAFDFGGNIVNDCTGTGRDIDNCNKFSGAAPATNLNGIYIASTENAKPGSDFFDDTISFFSQLSETVWKRIDSQPNNIEDMSNNNVGIGVDAASTMLDVLSEQNEFAGLGVESGKVLTNQICNIDGTACFDPSLIAGRLTDGGGMRCGTGEYMLGIRNGAPICGPVATHCNGSNLFVGVDSSGNPICRASPGMDCAASTRTRCTTNDISLPASTDQQSYSFTRGSCSTITYKCSNGVWSSFGSGGSCTFTATPTTNHNISCGNGYEPGDTYSETTTPHCGASSTVTNTRASDCTCVGGTFPNGSQTCSAAYGNNPNISGTIVKHITYTPPSCITSTGEDRSACVCNPPPVTTEWRNEGSCAAGETGTRQRKYVFNTALTTCGFQATDEYRGCSCDTTPRVTYEDHVCANPTCEKPDPANRDIITRQVANTATCELGPPTTEFGACIPKRFKWVQIRTLGTRAPTNPGASARYIDRGCTCNDFNSTRGGSAELCYSEGDVNFNQYECSCNEQN